MREYRAVYNAPCRSEKSGKPGYVPACAAVCQVPTGPGKAELCPFFKADIDWPTLPLLVAGINLTPRFGRLTTVGLETTAFHVEFFHMTRMSVKHKILQALKGGVFWTIR